MPRGDATGPMGMGPMTGRAAGFCAGYNMPGFTHNTPGRGLGMGYGRKMGFGQGFRQGGFGRGNRFYAGGAPGRSWLGASGAPYQNANPETEKQALKNQSDYLQTEMDAIKKRMDELNDMTK